MYLKDVISLLQNIMDSYLQSNSKLYFETSLGHLIWKNIKEGALNVHVYEFHFSNDRTLSCIYNNGIKLKTASMS